MKTINIGRSPGSDYVISDSAVSPSHALITVSDSCDVYIEDLGSVHGTFVDGEKIKSKTLLSSSSDVFLGSHHIEWKTIVQAATQPHVVYRPAVAFPDNIADIKSIGSNALSQIRFSFKDISDEHAYLCKRKDGSVLLIDNNSENGTFVNRVRISSPRVLKKGDSVLLSNRHSLDWETIYRPKSSINIARLRPVAASIVFNIIYLFRKIQHFRLIHTIRSKGTASVVFFASNLSMWKYQGLYDLLSKDPRFNVSVVLCPFASYSEQQRAQNLIELENHFRKLGIPYTNFYKNQSSLAEISSADIFFYPQPYSNLFKNELDAIFHEHKLICYYPYALFTAGTEWAYNCRLQNTAWRLFYPTNEHKKEAEKYSYIKGRNIVVVGSSDAELCNARYKNVWKAGTADMKKVIWAPHYSISGCGHVHRASFLWLADRMLEIASRYNGLVQFAFKPHPRLKTELYEHPDWGKKRADAYYGQWAALPNTQLEEGEYIDLFKGSDALIHDSGSFTAAYQYTQKPALFISDDIDGIKDELNDFGAACMDLHYFARDMSDVVSFIDDVVVGGNDTKSAERRRFVTETLMPPNGKSAAQNIFDGIVSSLRI